MKLKQVVYILLPIFFLALSLVIADWYGESLNKLAIGYKELTQIKEEPCSLNQGHCQLILGSQNWLFSVSPKEISTGTQLQFTLSSFEHHFHPPNSVWIHVMGDNMNMGLIRVNLKESPDKSWRATVILPACVRHSGAMRWRVRLFIESGQGSVTQADCFFVVSGHTSYH